MKYLIVNGIQIELEKKKIKNMYLKILPPDGKVKVVAPVRMGEEEIIRFVDSKFDWMIEHQKRLLNRELPKPLEYKSGEEICFWGKKYILVVEEIHSARSNVKIDKDKVVLLVKQDNTDLQKEKLLNIWYRRALQMEIPYLITKWEKRIGVRSNSWSIRDMKTR
jgi:predicted metal-dependent hydrolase